MQWLPKTERKTITAQAMYQIYNPDNIKTFIDLHAVTQTRSSSTTITADFRDIIKAYQLAREAELQPQTAEETAAPEVASEPAQTAE